MSTKFSLMLSYLPQFQEMSHFEVDQVPTTDEEFELYVRLFKWNKENNVSEPWAYKDAGFTLNDILSQEQKVKDYAMSLLREKRDALLLESDKITMKCYSQGKPVPSEWADYMNTLRDLPQTSAPDIGDDGSLTGVIFPEKPTISV